MKANVHRLVASWVAVAFAFLLIGCSSGSSSSDNNSNSSSTTGNVSMMVSDSPMNDWSVVGVKILSIALNPVGGGAAVTAYTAPSPAPVTNLVELDGLGELLDNPSVTPGTYSSATVTIAANPGDVMLTASEDPDTGFAGTAGAAVPSSQIQIQGATGASGSKTVSFNISFASNVLVTAGQNSQVDVEFDLTNPAFIVAHIPPSTVTATSNGVVEWAVNFNGPVFHHPIKDLTSFVLRDIYGTISTVSSGSMVITKDFPSVPSGSLTATAKNLTILADGTNGTLVYNLDASPIAPVTCMGFVLPCADATILTAGKFVRVTARYQVDGTLVGVRVFVSSTAETVVLSPEGHVLHVNNNTFIMRVANEAGQDVPIQITSTTNFYFRTPSSAQADATAIGTGTAFLSNIKRGFKVRVTAATTNPLTSPVPALTVDIEIARFDGAISNASPTGFDYTRQFATATDSYTNFQLNFIPNAAANGNDPLSGTAIAGFKWWNFSYPTKVTSNVTDTSTAQAISDFVTAASGSVNFGGSVGVVSAYGQSGALWSSNSNIWTVPFTILIPTQLPLGLAATGWSNNSFLMSVALGTNTATVDASVVSGSATLVYQVDRTNNIITISPVDLTTTAGQTTMSINLLSATPVKVAGVPESTAGHLKAYIIFFYTGNTAPTS